MCFQSIVWVSSIFKKFSETQTIYWKQPKVSKVSPPLQFSPPPLSTPNGNANFFFHFSPPPPPPFFFPPSVSVGREEKDRGQEEREQERWKSLVMTMWIRMHTSGVQRMWLLSSDHWELLNVFSLPEIKYCNLEWMTVFSPHYPSTPSKVCVDILTRMSACVNSHTTAQIRVCVQWHRQTTVVHFQIVQLWSVQLWSVCATMSQTDHSYYYITM